MPMTLDEALLKSLESWKPKPGRDTLAFDEPAASVHLTVDHLETLSCQVWELRVRRSKADDLTHWAKRIAHHATGLLEKLHLLEIDAHRGQAILRSTKPAQKSENLFYYEVMLDRSGSACLRRYQGSYQSGKRKQVGFVLTREAIAKLAADLAA
jgi:hypothetical protein